MFRGLQGRLQGDCKGTSRRGLSCLCLDPQPDLMVKRQNFLWNPTSEPSKAARSSKCQPGSR